jgi:hypothetical protein
MISTSWWRGAVFTVIVLAGGLVSSGAPSTSWSYDPNALEGSTGNQCTFRFPQENTVEGIQALHPDYVCREELVDSALRLYKQVARRVHVPRDTILCGGGAADGEGVRACVRNPDGTPAVGVDTPCGSTGGNGCAVCNVPTVPTADHLRPYRTCHSSTAGQLIADLEILRHASLGTPLAAEIDDVLVKARTIVAELQETPSDREGAMGKMEATVGELEGAIASGAMWPGKGTTYMSDLADIARGMATAAINEAIARDGRSDRIFEAQRELAKGDILRTAASFRAAIKEYRGALAKAEDA